MRAGDYAINLATGEVRLVVEYSTARDEVTFSDSQRWESAKPWRTNVSLPKGQHDGR